MAMSDCDQCWETPCSCGFEYRKMTKSARIALAAVILGIDKNTLILGIGGFIPEKHPQHDKEV